MSTVSSLNVLIVEDDTDARKNLRDVLDTDGYRVETATTAAEAFGRTDLAETDVVILGRRLLDGYVEDVLPRLREIAPDATIIVATEYTDLESTIAALRLGVADYILKPIDVDSLKSSLSRIFERRQIGAALRDRETRLQAILNTAVDAIITIDERGLIESLNTAAVQLFGYSPEEAIGGNVGMLMPSPYGDEHDDYLDRYRETGQRRIIGIGREVVGRHKDGTVFPIELTVSEVILGSRRLFTGIVRDISFRKQAEEQLQLLGTALGVLNEGVVITEAALDFPGPRILFVNEAMTRITGYTRVELLSKTPRIFQGVKTDRAVMQRLKQELSAGRPFVGETVNYRKDGREFFVQLQIVSVFDDSGCVTNYVSTHRDVIELRAAQHRLLQSERLAAIGKAMTGLAHESRNALQRSQASLEMLARRIDDRPEAVDPVARIQRAQDDLHRLYEEVREYAAPTRFHPKMTNVAEILHEAWEHLDVQRNERQACLTETYGDRPVAEADDLSCEVDRFALRQVFRNILENAFAACDDPVEIGVQYASIASADKPMMRISIRDNGPGLTAEAATRIFEEFFTTKTHGTGLGMAICRRFIEAHSGRIEVGEETGPGTEIIITLPRRQS